MMYPIAKVCLQSKNQNIKIIDCNVKIIDYNYLSAYYYNLPITCSYLIKIGPTWVHVSTATLFKWGT